MSNKFIKPNWQAINKAIDGDDPEAKKLLRQELKELTKKIDDKFYAAWKGREAKREQDRITALKNLSVGTEVFYIGRSKEIPFGTKGEKVRDGRTRMVIKVAGQKWNVYYTHLQENELTNEQKVSNRVVNKLNDFLNK